MTDDLDAFDTYLRDRGLLDRTRRAYVGVVSRSAGDVASYVRRLVRQRAPEGTVVQARAAAGHWLRFRGVAETEIRILLPSARGRKGRRRDALSREALELFLRLADAEREPLRTVLLLLPRTGLRISEVCTLHASNVRQRDGRTYLDFRGKGDKHRLVPVGSAGAELLHAAVDKARGGPLFSLAAKRPIAPSTVRDALVRLRAGQPGLETVTPHVLRHTYATRALAAGMDMPRLQAILGHESITTTQRYLHPSVDDLADAVDAIEGL